MAARRHGDRGELLRSRPELVHVGLRDEGMFEAYQYFQGTGDMAGAVERFNQYGKKKIDPATLKEEQVQDPLLGRPYSRVKGKYEDGSVFVFDPVRMAEAAGGIKAFMDRRGKEGDQAIKTRGKQAELAAEYGLKGELAEKGHGLTMAEIAARGTQDRKTVAARGAEDRRTKSVADAGEKAVFKATEGMKVLVSRYGGKLEGGMWFPDEANRDVALRASVLLEQNLQRGLPAMEAASQAAQMAEREKAEGRLPIGQAPAAGGAPAASAPGNSGATDYSSLWN